MSTSVPVASLVHSEQFNTLNPWPKRTSSLPLCDITPDGKKTTCINDKNKVVTVAISGCSSSGKSTLALLLAEIFSTPTALLNTNLTNPQINLNDSMTDLCLTSSNKENVKPSIGMDDGELESAILDDGRAIVVYQDAFFLPKTYCPLVAFTSTPADVNFITQTLVNDTVGTYILSWEGSRIGKQHNLDHSLSDLGDSKDTTSAANGPHADGWKPMPPVWRVTGPDTDCWAALDIPSLVSAIKEIQETGTDSSLCERYRKEDLKLPGLLMSAAERHAIVLKNVELISEMKDIVKSWTKDQAVSNAESRFEGLNIQGAIETGNGRESLCPKVAIVEGFLLFPNPSETARKSNDSDKENENPALQNELGDELGTPEERTTFDMQEVEIAAYEKINAASRKQLMSHFNIKLFLPTSIAQAKQRRFARHLYIDAPNGERHPGQMWKSDGYFTHIAWGNYVKECGWLVEADGVESSAEAVKHGVHVRPVMDLGVEDTVRWAVDIILGELGKKVCHSNSNTAQYGSGRGDEELDYEDDNGDVAMGNRQKLEKSTKKNVVREKLSALKGRLLELVNFNNKTKPAAKDGKDNTKRDSVSSFVRKRKVTKAVKAKTKEKLLDIGLKTVLGSGVADRGFFSPKPQYRRPRHFGS